MNHFILTILLLLTALSYNLTAQQISSETYNKDYIHEDFNQVGENFKVVTTTDNYFILDKGDYLLSRNNSESEYAIIAKNSIISDFVLKTVIRIGPSDNKKASLGIILKAQQDGKGAIIFEVNKQGEYRIKQLVGSTYQTLSGKAKQEGWVKNKLVNGVDEHNFIEIRSEKNIYDVYANSKYLTTFFVPDFTNGSCGLIISPETKARVSYYYINIKGDDNVIANYTNENTQSVNTTIEELNKKIKLLEENNAKLNKLNTETRGIQAEELEKLNSNNTNLATITLEQEKEIKNLNNTITDLNSKAAKVIDLENKKTKNLNTISTLESKNTILHTEIQDLNSQLTNTKAKNTSLTAIAAEQEQKIKSLTTSTENLKNSSDKITTSNQQLNKKIKILKQEVNLKKSINTELINDIDKLNKSSNSQITQLNTQSKELEAKISTLTKSNNTLASDLSSSKNTFQETKTSLLKSAANKTVKIKRLRAELTKLNNELTTLKNTQSKHDDATVDLNAQITNLNNRLEALNNQLNTSNNDVNTLQAKNADLKELFIQKDFEINGVKPSELTKQTNTHSAPKELKGNSTIYAVQFGVYMQVQPYAALKGLDEVRYETTEHGTYVYLSGEFKLPQEATAHKNSLITLGYPNAFVVTLTK